jgi:dolichol-phosphate mannosyltransferase
VSSNVSVPGPIPRAPKPDGQVTTISIVIPAYNEEGCVDELARRLQDVFTGLGPRYEFEAIIVENGSADATFERLEAIAAADDRFTIVQLSRNFLMEGGMIAGLDRATGDAAVIMSADLQDPPSVFPAFLEKFREGFEVVYAVRQNRKESLWKRVAYGSFYRIFRRFADVEVPLDAGDFGLISRAVRDQIITMPERDVLVRGLRTWVGFRQTGVPYDRPERDAGETKYTLAKLIRLAAAGFFDESWR